MTPSLHDRPGPLKITVWGINYAPELTGIAPYNTLLCEYLRAQGHEVRMVTAFAYYPAWRKEPPDRWRMFRMDEVAGVTVHRCWHYVPRKVNTWRRVVHEASFVFTSFMRQLVLPKPDLQVVVSPPLLLGAAAWLLSKLKSAPFVFHVQDLQPDAAAGLGLLKNGRFIRMLYALEKFAYERACCVCGISEGMLEAFRRKGVSPGKLVLFPNPVVLPDREALPKPGAFRARHGFRPEQFLAIYSGNLGVKQGLDVLIDAARQLDRERVGMVICGDGNRREALETLVRRHDLSNVRLLPLQPERLYHEMLADADLCLITQQPRSGQCFFPSKLLTTLAFGKPVLTVADEGSELARVVQEGWFGLNVEPNQPGRLAEVLERLAGQTDLLREMGRAGREFVEQYEQTTVLSQFEGRLREVLGRMETALPERERSPPLPPDRGARASTGCKNSAGAPNLCS